MQRGDALESSEVGGDTILRLWDVRVLNGQVVFRREHDVREKAFLAPSSPTPRNERAGAQVEKRNVIDDLVDELLGK